MTAIAVAERIVDAPLSEAFALFIDFSRWDLWMPAMFTPVTGPARGLQVGDTFKTAVDKRGFLKLELEVVRVRPNKELCWRGGGGLVRGEHSFLFADADGRTLIRSEETITGPLVRGPVATMTEKICIKVGEAVLGGFSDHLTKRHKA